MERFKIIFLMVQSPVIKISVSKKRHFSYIPVLHYECNKLHNRLITFSMDNALYLINTHSLIYRKICNG